VLATTRPQLATTRHNLPQLAHNFQKSQLWHHNPPQLT
jgi:hypothetical protein